MNMQTNSGFTLIELVIAMLIISILASIAYPAYTEQVQKSRRADCAAELTLFANEMERFATSRGTYVGGGGDFINGTCPINGGTPVYDFSVVAANGSTFSIQAAPRGPQATDKCGILTLDNLGRKGMNGAAAGLNVQDCW
ncbi:MAG TPA: type IV pilin protein [Gammaproteobacteria bacterium]|nr:type IV pilin protein [Gammaproteobacteria bacterium]